MRTLIAAAILISSVPSRAKACVVADITIVRGAPIAFGNYDEPARAIVPPRPSLFVHLGSNGPSGMPLFSTLDGTPIPVAKTVPIQDDTPYWNLQRVDLDIDQGALVVRLPGSDVPVATYLIDPAFTPNTRSAEVLSAGMTLWVDSDAVAFRVEGRGVGPEIFNNGAVPLVTGRQQRVTALYPDGREEVIYDDVPTERVDQVAASKTDRVEDAGASSSSDRELLLPTALVLLFLGMTALARYATPRSD